MWRGRSDGTCWESESGQSPMRRCGLKNDRMLGETSSASAGERTAGSRWEIGGHFGISIRRKNQYECDMVSGS